jgi:NADH-quinone oxidoreductase subunit D
MRSVTDSLTLVTNDLGAALRPDASSLTVLDRQHPSAAGLISIDVQVEDRVIVSADPHLGYMHRAAEKLLEVRDYRQGLALLDRHDWTGGGNGELALALLLEQSLGIEVPTRAVWLRTQLSELGRLTSHLAFLTHFPTRGLPMPASLTAAREAVLALLESYGGSRLHPALLQVGGLRADSPDGWTDAVAAATRLVRDALAAATPVVASAADTLGGVGVLSREGALAFGASGLVARASGIDRDLRRDTPYLAYTELGDKLHVPVHHAGDAAARVQLLLEQSRVAVDLVDACNHGIPDGPVNVRLPKVLRAPEGQAWCATEAPLGTNGYWLVSHGERAPYRLKIRSASFAHAALLSRVLVGVRLSNADAVIASMCIITGDADR